MKQNTKTIKTKTTKQNPFLKFLIATGLIMLPLIGGSIITIFTINAQESFSQFTQPPLAPPAWLFPVAWTILYILMGVASYLIFRQKIPKAPKQKALALKRLKTAELTLFYLQLAFNFAWTLLFFNANLKYFAFGWLVAMWLMILALIILCWRNCKTATWLLLPYILWCTFAAYLNLSIAILN